MVADENKLIENATRGDRDALASLLAVYDASLRRWVDGRIGRQYRSAFGAGDVLQITYLEVFLGIGRFLPRGDGSFRAWLWQIADRNLKDAIEALNRDKRPPPDKRVDQVRGDDEPYIGILDLLDASGTTPSGRANRRDVCALVETALQQLPPDYQVVVRRFYLSRASVVDIARDMDRSIGAVHMIKRRALDWLRDILGQSSAFFTKKP